MRKVGALILAVLLWCVVSMSTHAAEGYASVGKTSARPSTGVASVGVRFERYGLEATWINESYIYNGSLREPAFAMVTGYRYWEFSDRHVLGATPETIIGLSLKGSDRCKQQGELDCNRLMPLPFAFHFGLGLQWKAMRIDLYHDSNDALDYGPENKNRGINWVHLTYRFVK